MAERDPDAVSDADAQVGDLLGGDPFPLYILLRRDAVQSLAWCIERQSLIGITLGFGWYDIIARMEDAVG